MVPDVTLAGVNPIRDAFVEYTVLVYLLKATILYSLFCVYM